MIAVAGGRNFLPCKAVTVSALLRELFPDSWYFHSGIFDLSYLSFRHIWSVNGRKYLFDTGEYRLESPFLGFGSLSPSIKLASGSKGPDLEVNLRASTKAFASNHIYLSAAIMGLRSWLGPIVQFRMSECQRKPVISLAQWIAFLSIPGLEKRNAWLCCSWCQLFGNETSGSSA